MRSTAQHSKAQRNRPSQMDVGWMYAGIQYGRKVRDNVDPDKRVGAVQCEEVIEEDGQMAR